MQADGRCAGRQLLSGVQFCLITMLATNGFSAYQMEFGCNPVDNFGWGDGDGDLLFAQDTSPSGQSGAQWKPRTMAQEAALRGIAKSKLRRILAFNNSFRSAGARVGDEVLFYEAPSRKSAPRWRGPAKALLLDESGAILSFRGQTSQVARHCVRKKVRAPAESEASCDEAFDDLCRPTPPREVPEPPPNPPLGSPDLYKCHLPPSPGALSPDFASLGERARLRTEESQMDIGAPSQDPHCVATDDQGPLDSFDEVCARTQGPPVTRTGYEELSHRDLHDLRKQGGSRGKIPKPISVHAYVGRMRWVPLGVHQ